MQCYRQRISLADNEWGNELMRNIAMDALMAHDEPMQMVVEVHEHAGWYITYALDLEGVVAIGSANDMAQPTYRARKVAERFKGATWVYLPSIRRETVPVQLPIEGRKSVEFTCYRY